MNKETLSLIGSGPLVVLFLAACLASTVLAAALVGRASGPAGLIERAARRLERGRRAAVTLWGVSAVLLTAVLAGGLFSVKALGLVGVGVSLAGLGLLGLGAGAAALALGRELLGALGSEDGDPAASLRSGLAALIVASVLPFAGWLLAAAALAGGVGAVLETALVRRRPDVPPSG
jgi:hypothetical protein